MIKMRGIQYGIKFFDSNGFKLPDATEEKIEELLRHSDEIPRPTGEKVGVIRHVHDQADIYRNYVKSTAGTTLSGFRLITDSANGAASDYLPQILEELGAEVIATHREPNGVNINNNCGSTHIESLQERVLAEGADCGIANDGDADRCLFVDERGQVLDGDHLMLINSLRMKKEGRLNHDMVVGTVMSNLGFGKALKEHGINTVSTKVGDRYVLEEMRKNGYSIGGEQSGHIIFLDENTTGDGLLSALHLLQVMVETGKPLSELAQIMEVLPQALVNAKVANHKKEKYMEYPEIADAIQNLEEKFAGEGRVLIRPSGTEPLVRVMIEGKDQQVIQEEAQRLANLIQDIMF